LLDSLKQGLEQTLGKLSRDFKVWRLAKILKKKNSRDGCGLALDVAILANQYRVHPLR
jgi:hypothetical protein